MSKIKVKAGILLYALFMAAVFSLLLTKEAVTEESGQLAFDKGSTHYRRQGNMLEVSSQLANQKSYSFYFESKKEPEKKDKEAKDSKDTKKTKVPSPSTGKRSD